MADECIANLRGVRGEGKRIPWEPSHLTDGQIAQIRKIVDEAIVAHAEQQASRLAGAISDALKQAAPEIVAHATRERQSNRA